MHPALVSTRAPSRTPLAAALVLILCAAGLISCGRQLAANESAQDGGAAAVPATLDSTDPSLWPLFREATTASELASFQFRGIGALAVGDIDGDGLDDIITAADFAVFKNLGGLAFEDVTNSSGVELDSGLSIALGDLDNDADLDFVVSGFQQTQVWENDGEGHFAQAYELFGTPDLGASNIVLADLNNDSLLDVFLVYPASFNFRDPRVSSVTLLNAGSLDFAEASSSNQKQTPAVAWAAAIIDSDRDGDIDIYVANDSGVVDYGFSQVETNQLELPGNHLWKNEPAPTQDFSEGAQEVGLGGRNSAMGALVEDFNGDGLFDIFVPDFGRNKLHLAQADGHYVEAIVELGLGASHMNEGECNASSEERDCLLVSWGSAYRDFDLDGTEDLLVFNHNEEKAQPTQLFQRSGFAFTEVDSGLPSSTGHTLVPVDLDLDGDLDLVVTTYFGELKVFENTTHTKERPGNDDTAWLGIHLQGRQSNRAGVGAVVQADLSFDGAPKSVFRLVGSGGVAHASLPTPVHVGLGTATVTQVTVTWPSGAVSQLTAPANNRNHTLIEPPILD